MVKARVPQGFKAWCVSANDLREGGQINASNHPKSVVLSKVPIFGLDESAVTIELAGGAHFLAKVVNSGNGKFYCFRPA